ncbi:hypothetical protein CKO25_01500 [Thiocapsa imhoffii]|uniref:Uncharacterized protein n=1 Tax=Thiocapsa imhoffii TaxID=382777 RepID=A0A9X0WF04_9GAMM|nr:hypothetical protein [Thiocapsa imhoffii]
MAHLQGVVASWDSAIKNRAQGLVSPKYGPIELNRTPILIAIVAVLDVKPTLLQSRVSRMTER